jgi:predicted dehydrogenase
MDSKVSLNGNINFALMGCGRIAEKHAGILSSQLPGARLVGVCDVVAERAEAFGRKYNVPAFTSLEQMMSAIGKSIDVVNILTPSGYHAQHTFQVARYGCHVVVEKPMALALEDAEEMVRVCNRAGVRLFVVKQNRFNKPVQKLREAMDAGRFGKIAVATVRVRWCRKQAYYDQDSWRGTWLLDGGVFANQASHHVDLLSWLLGDVNSVFAYTARQLVDIEAEDTGVVVLRFRNGALGIIEATTAARPKDLEGSVSILGERGTVEIGGFAVNQMKEWQFESPQPEDALVMSEFNENPPNVYGFGHFEYLAHVCEALRNSTPAMVDGIEGLKSLALINAIYDSAESGREVNMRFVPQHTRLGQKEFRRRGDPELEELKLLKSLYQQNGQQSNRLGDQGVLTAVENA